MERTKIDRAAVPALGDRLWTVPQVSDYLGVPVATLYVWRHRGTGPKAYRVGRYLRYDPADVRHWLDQLAA